jgi:peptidoglycan glycosyltransferase
MLVVLTFFLVVAVAVVSFSGWSTYKQVAATLKPRLAALQDREVFETSRIYDRRGKLLYEFFDAGRRTRVDIAEVSPLLINATIAIEDKTFFENSGVDYEGILRALYQNYNAGGETSGASTITQQLIKNIILNEEERKFENRYERKFKEIILAQELNKVYSKEQILELYLNEVYYGNLAYGIEAASQVYFGVSADELTLAQASLLGGLPQLPSRYDPTLYQQRDEQGKFLPGYLPAEGWLDPSHPLPEDIPPPKWRQTAVLRQMVDEGYVSAAAARAALAENLYLAPQEVPLHAPHFVFYVRKMLEEKYGKQLVTSGGLNITTTLDLDMQRMAQKKAAEHIESLEDRNIHNAAVVVMQPNTGQILAMVGSVDYDAIKPTTTPGETGNVLDGQVNVAIRERQPGSALKPFTYLAAMERGMTPATVIWDVPTEFPTGDGRWYAPENYNGRWNGPVRIRTALANSLNMPAVKALKFAGIDNTLDLLDRVGIKKGLKHEHIYYGLSLTLGGGEVTLLELTTAYNTLASEGKYYPPTPVLKITNNDGQVLESFEYEPGQQVINPGMNSIITDMLSDDKARAPIWGVGSKLKLSRPAAVKTGTSNDWRDAWTLGYSPYVTVGVWSGNNNNEPTVFVESLEGGGIIWHNIMEELFDWIDDQKTYRNILMEPIPGKSLPTAFTLPEDGSVQRKPVCPLPGAFGGYNEELFTREMVYGTSFVRQTPSVTTASDRSSSDQFNGTCDVYTTINVVKVPGGGYCLPVQGQSYDPDKMEKVTFWNLPPADPDERVRYVWSGGDASYDRPNIPFCTARILTVPTPIRLFTPTPTMTPSGPAPMDGAIQMPSVYGLSEAEARVILQSIGVRDIYIDYQTRERIPDAFDQYIPNTVISTLPRAGNWILPGSSVILGVRAPDNYDGSTLATPGAESAPSPQQPFSEPAAATTIPGLSPTPAQTQPGVAPSPVGTTVNENAPPASPTPEAGNQPDVSQPQAEPAQQPAQPAEQSSPAPVVPSLPTEEGPTPAPLP